jgi:hypothetical protein
LDRSFADGVLLFTASSRYQWGGQTITIQPDGKLLIAGFVVDEADYFIMAAPAAHTASSC